MLSIATDRKIVGGFGNAISAFLFLSPLPTFSSIYKKGAVEGFSSSPYIVTIFNCLLWVYYGAIHPDSLLVITINGAGLVIEFMYVVFYFYYAKKNQRKWVIIKSLIGIVIFSLVVFLCSFVPKSKYWNKAVASGVAADILNITMYAMPCDAIIQVYKTKSLEYMPFWLSLVGFVNGALWLTYSLLGFDLYILISNGSGLIFGSIQLGFIAYYYVKYPQPKDYISWPNLRNWWKFLKSKIDNKIVDEKAGGGGKVELSDMV
ncbi:hypothetical protein MKX03_029478 [Papaver bracteatum]|nr:hypothetical protein MKX03_029478 [Papaver bracteatum]